jgi:sensor histidine kinase YesM
MGDRGLFRIRTRYLFLVLFSILVFLASGYLVLRSISAEAEKNAAEYMLGNLRSVSTIVDEIANNVEFVFTPLLGDPDFLNQASDLGFLNPVRTYEDYLRMKKLEGFFKASYLSNRYISSISYFDIRSGLMLDASSYLHFPSAANARSSEWYANFEKAGASPVWTMNSLYGEDERVLSSYRVIRGFNGAWRDLAVVSINIRSRDIADIIGRTTQGMAGSLVVLDALGNLIVDSGSAGPEDLAKIVDAGAGHSGEGRLGAPGTLVLAAGDFRAVPYVSSRTGLRFVGLLPLKRVTSFLPQLTAYIAYSYLALLLVVIFLAATSYRSFYRPLSQLSEGMREFSRGNFSIRIESRKDDEIALLFRTFNDMVSKLKRLIDDNYLIKLEQKDARM